MQGTELSSPIVGASRSGVVAIDVNPDSVSRPMPGKIMRKHLPWAFAAIAASMIAGSEAEPPKQPTPKPQRGQVVLSSADRRARRKLLERKLRAR